MSKAKQKAQSIQCISNQRQIVMGFRMAMDEDLSSSLDEAGIRD
jgi:hypothetical protein